MKTIIIFFMLLFTLLQIVGLLDLSIGLLCNAILGIDLGLLIREDYRMKEYEELAGEVK